MTTPMTPDKNQTTTLLPCPFCGGEPELVLHAPERWVFCQQCKASGDTVTHESTAIEKWNTRSSTATSGREEIKSLIRSFVVNEVSVTDYGSKYRIKPFEALIDAILAIRPVGSERTTDHQIDAAYAEGAAAVLARLYAADARQDKHHEAWEYCETIVRERRARLHEHESLTPLVLGGDDIQTRRVQPELSGHDGSEAKSDGGANG